MLLSQASRLNFLTVTQPQKGNTMNHEKPLNKEHKNLIYTFSELTLLQIALLLDSVLYATTEAQYRVCNVGLDELKDSLSHTLALHIISGEV